jgi:signal transduction histidine kinase
MLLTFDVGNTETTLGLYDGAQLRAHWRIMTDVARTPDEFGVLLRGLLAGQAIALPDVTGVAIGSVVPPVTAPLAEACREWLPATRVEIIDARSPLPITLQVDEPLTVLADPVRLTQIFVNILTNALKYSGEARQIDITATKKDQNVVVSIRDYGPGIHPELLSRIFEPFVQAKPTVTLEGGLGLGLAVVRQLVSLHGGRVEAFSSGEPPGSEFVIHLPLAPAP